MRRRLPEHMADNGTFTFALAARERSDCSCLDAKKLSEAPGVALREGDQGGSGVLKGGVNVAALLGLMVAARRPPQTTRFSDTASRPNTNREAKAYRGGSEERQPRWRVPFRMSRHRAGQPLELEIKFHLPPDAQEVVDGHPALQSASVRRLHQITTYFDTPAGDLFREGVTLRVRRCGKGLVQTLKQEGERNGLRVPVDRER
jgi:CYTH domain